MLRDPIPCLSKEETIMESLIMKDKTNLEIKVEEYRKRKVALISGKHYLISSNLADVILGITGQDGSYL